MFISNRGLELIKEFEGCKLTAYKCPAGIWTIGYGHTGLDVYKGLTISAAHAVALLREDIRQFEKDVTSLLKVPVNQNQFDALVSFAFNLGSDIDKDDIAEGLGDSTLLKKVNSMDFAGAALEFPKWNKAGGKVLAGLSRRRAAEQRLFLSVV